MAQERIFEMKANRIKPCEDVVTRIMTAFLFAVCLFAFSTRVVAQTSPFITAGTIEFSKTINMHAVLGKRGMQNPALQPAIEEYKRTRNQFLVQKSVLSFSKDKALFKPLAAEKDPARTFFNDDPLLSQLNVVFTDLGEKKRIIQKQVFEDAFLLQQTLPRPKWKITDETREIAGYVCRRANGLWMDSIYVVAFYNDEILPPGGPESFSGLPGMILGIALPHENVSWFATKVVPMTQLPEALMPPSIGKTITTSELVSKLEASFNRLEKSANRFLKWFFL